MIIKRKVAGESVTLNVLPPRMAEGLWNRWLAHVEANEGGLIGFDVETTAIDEVLGPFEPHAKLRLVQFGSRKYAWALDPTNPFWRKRIDALLNFSEYRFVSHTNYDSLWANREFNTPIDERFIDSIVLASLCFPGQTVPKGLKDLCDKLIDRGLSEAETELIARFKELAPTGQRVGKKLKSWGFTNIPLDDPIFATYAGLDAIYVRRLTEILGNKIKQHKNLAALSRREQQIARWATQIRLRGHLVDAAWTQDILDDIESDYIEAGERISARIGGNKPLSPKRGDWLIAHDVRFTARTPTGLPKLDAEHVTELVERYENAPDADPEVLAMLQDMQIMSTHKNILQNLRIIVKSAENDGLTHAEIRTQAAHTGRMSIVKPAMQTFKKNDPRLRGCYVFREGFVGVKADYDNQETRIAAAFSQDENLLRIVWENLNQHELTAEEIFGKGDNRAKPADGGRSNYDKAKTMDFALIFGTGASHLGDMLGYPSHIDRESGRRRPHPIARQMWEAWWETYAGLREWNARMAKSEVIINPWGRRIPADPWRPYANGNYAIQSTGREILGDAMVKLADAGWSEYFWLPVHDEMILEVPEARAEEAMEALRTCMYAKLRNVELTATPEIVGSRWGVGE